MNLWLFTPHGDYVGGCLAVIAETFEDAQRLLSAAPDLLVGTIRYTVFRTADEIGDFAREREDVEQDLDCHDSGYPWVLEEVFMVGELPERVVLADWHDG